MINVIAHKSMMLAFGEGVMQVDGRHVALASDDTAAVVAVPGRGSWLGRLLALGSRRLGAP